jgi:ureidoglycolate dehydrogenase (NAD+)
MTSPAIDSLVTPKPSPPCETLRVSASDLRHWGQICLEKLGMPAEDARLLAERLVLTSLWGIDSHGIARLPHYFGRISGGSIHAKPVIQVQATGLCTARVDGGHGHGIVICTRAMEEAISLALTNGIGAVGVENSSHCGAIGLYGRQAASKGLVAFALTHSDAFVAPYGGRSKFLGTNPICLAVPTDDPERPICLDMATSAVPWNRVMNARRENTALEPGWALDAQGKPTIDAHAVACLLPLDDYKGYGLAFLIDLFCGPLNGMPFGPNIPAMYGDNGEHRRLGSFMMAINPKMFGGGEMLAHVATAMAKEARAQPLAEGANEVLVPGDPEYRNQEERSRVGIPIDPGLLEEMKTWSQTLGVAMAFAPHD